MKTDYGWHVIKLEDRKQGGAQPFDQVKAGIKAVLMRKKVQDTVTELRKEAKIEIIDPDLKKLQEMGEKKMEELKKKGTAAPDSGQPAAARSQPRTASRICRRSSSSGFTAGVMSQKISPLAPDRLPELPAIAGVKLAAAEAGIRYHGRPDVMLAVLEPALRCRRVYPLADALGTRRMVRGQCRQGKGAGHHRQCRQFQCFHRQGRHCKRTAVTKSVADALNCKPSEVFIASTGVIGEPLDPALVTRVVPKLTTEAGADGWGPAAHAILTTDTFAKMVSVTARYAGEKVTINGFAKGSGMIAPDMATMLAFFFTDAPRAGPHSPGTVEKRGCPELQLHHGRRRHIDLGHIAAGSDGPCRSGAQGPQGPR